jgi:hypothetical protein
VRISIASPPTAGDEETVTMIKELAEKLPPSLRGRGG